MRLPFLIKIYSGGTLKFLQSSDVYCHQTRKIDFQGFYLGVSRFNPGCIGDKTSNFVGVAPSVVYR